MALRQSYVVIEDNASTKPLKTWDDIASKREQSWGIKSWLMKGPMYFFVFLAFMHSKGRWRQASDQKRLWYRHGTFVLNLLYRTYGHLWSEVLSAPSFGRYCKQPIRSAYITFTGDASLLILPQEMASSGRAPLSEPSNSEAVFTNTLKSAPFL